MEKNKIYYYYGYKIERVYHYVDAYQHYDYIVDWDGEKETYPSLKAAKNAVRTGLGMKPLK